MQRFFFFRLKTRIPVTTMLITKWIAIKEKKNAEEAKDKKTKQKKPRRHPPIDSLGAL